MTNEYQPLPHELEDHPNINTGCCCPKLNGLPNRYKKSDDGDEIVRLNLPCYGLSCSAKEVLSEGDMKNTPYLMKNRGVRDDEWRRRMKDLQEINDTVSKDCCSIVSCALAVIFAWPLAPFWLPSFCKKRANRIEEWDTKMRKWQNDFNSETLERLGIFMKTQSYCWVTHGPKGEKIRHYDRWLAFSLTDGEKVNLQSEPHIMGDIENWSNCWNCPGINEEKLCWHT